jgi:lipopolysaccharide export system protein LptA
MLKPAYNVEKISLSNWRHLLPLACLAVVSLLTSAPAIALKSDREQPMDLKAQSWSGSLKDGKQSWNGNVRVVQGSLKINADSGVLHYHNGEIGKAEFSGAPATIEQTQDGGGLVRVAAKKIDYDLERNAVILSGGVKIEDGGNVTTGERFEYALDTGAIKGDGGTGEVSMRIVPKPAPKSP